MDRRTTGVAVVLRALFVVYAAATALHIGLVMAHEPFAFDAWNIAVDTRAEPFSFARFADYIGYEYVHSNPRIGQWFTYLAYKLTYFAPIATPIAYLGLALAISVLGLGRWPGRTAADGSRRTGRDLALVAIAIGCVWFALPHIGMIMFCRAYGANYLYGAAIQLWFLVPLRLCPTGLAPRRACIAYAIFGVAAGMCNEHTGPTLVVFMVGYAVWRQRSRRAGPRPWLAWAGALGSAVGFAAIFFAPGQASRYEGLASKVSLVGRLLQRGVNSNLAIFGDWVVALAPVLGLTVIALALARRDGAGGRAGRRSRGVPARPGADTAIPRAAAVVALRPIERDAALAMTQPLAALESTQPLPPVAATEPAATTATAAAGPASLADALADPLRLIGLALLAGTLITVTVFVSPKLGPRFYLHGCALVLAGFVAVADRTLTTPGRLAPFVVVAALASMFAGVRTLPLYYRLSDASDERLAALAATPPGSVFTAESFEQVDDSWWFLGDDFRDVKKRDLVATYFGLGGVIFRAVAIEAPLGVSDVALVPRYQVTPPSCIDEHGGLDLGIYRGIDIASLHQAAAAAIARLRDHLAPAGTLDRLDLVVGFTGAPPPLPRPTLLVGRWLPTGFEHYDGLIERKGTSKTRSIKLPKELAGSDFEIYAFQVGGEARRLGSARDAVFEYVPWKRGSYWALACHPTECFVFAAMRVQ